MIKVYDKPCAKHHPDFCDYCAAKQRGCEYAEEQISVPTLTPLRAPPFVCVIGETHEKVVNPITNESVILPPDAFAVWQVIANGEKFNQYKEVLKGWDWLLVNEPEAYNILIA